MIKPIEFSNVSFKGSDIVPNTGLDSGKIINLQNQEETNQSQDKKSFSDRFENAKTKVVNTLKTVNTTAYTTGGIIKGLISGALATAVTGIIGKNIKDAEGQIGGTVKRLGSDIWKGTKAVFSFVPSLITKSPLENAKNLLSLPKNFYGKSYLNIFNKAGEGIKTHKATAAIATSIGIGVALFSTIKGKINANEKNADLDHKTNRGHIK